MAHKPSFPGALTHDIGRLDLLWQWIRLGRDEFRWWDSCAISAGLDIIWGTRVCLWKEYNTLYTRGCLKDRGSAWSLLCGYSPLKLRVPFSDSTAYCTFRGEGPSFHFPVLLPPRAGRAAVRACTGRLGGQLVPW